MNIIVTNKYRDLLNSANIEIIKELNGVYQVSELVNSFNSIFYKKLIIDATALSKFPKEEVLKELVNRFDTEKIVLFLPPDNPPPKKFLSFLVSINLYNFTDNIQGVIELVHKSNTYEDVLEYAPVQNTYSDTYKEEIDFSQNKIDMSNGKIILGLKNVNKEAGSTTLTYLLKKTLEEVHKKRVLAVEIEKRDFMFYNTKNMYSIDKNKLGEFFSIAGNSEIVLVDLDSSDNLEICSDVIYLVDPSLFKINQLLFTKRNALANLKGKKVILTNSLLSEKDVNTFAKEAGISVYFNLPPLNDRTYNPILDALLSKLGLVEDFNEKPKRGLFDIFK